MCCFCDWCGCYGGFDGVVVWYVCVGEVGVDYAFGVGVGVVYVYCVVICVV